MSDLYKEQEQLLCRLGLKNHGEQTILKYCQNTNVKKCVSEISPNVIIVNESDLDYFIANAIYISTSISIALLIAMSFLLLIKNDKANIGQRRIAIMPTIQFEMKMEIKMTIRLSIFVIKPITVSRIKLTYFIMSLCHNM